MRYFELIGSILSKAEVLRGIYSTSTKSPSVLTFSCDPRKKFIVTGVLIESN